MSNVSDVKRKAVKITLNDGVERELKFTLNALAELEDKFGSVDVAFEKLDEGSMKALRFILWAGFTHNEKEDLSEKQVGNLIDLAYMAELTQTLGSAFQSDLGPQESMAEPLPVENDANPNE